MNNPLVAFLDVLEMQELAQDGPPNMLRVLLTRAVPTLALRGYWFATGSYQEELFVARFIHDTAGSWVYVYATSEGAWVHFRTQAHLVDYLGPQKPEGESFPLTTEGLGALVDSLRKIG